MGYFRQTLKGVSWMGLLRGSTRVIAFVKIGILARILTPDEFGLFAIASLVLAFLEIITDTGINVFLIQGEGEIKKYLNTAWVVSIARGILITTIMYLGASFISDYFNSPNAYPLLVFMSIVPFVRGLINPLIITYQKELQFQKEFLVRFFIFLTDASIATIVALITHSAISMVWGIFAGVVLEVILSFAIFKPWPKLKIDFVKIKHLVRRGKWVTAYRIFDYAFRQGDDIVVGRLLASSALGIYQVGYKISSLPISEVADVFGRVVFPVYSKIADDKKRLKKAFLKTFASISLLVIPFGFVFYLFPELIVKILLGNQWLEAVPVIRTLAVFGILRGLAAPATGLFLALKKQEYVTVVTFFGILGLALTIYPFVTSNGIIGAARAALVGAFAIWPPIIYYLLKIFKNEKS